MCTCFVIKNLKYTVQANNDKFMCRNHLFYSGLIRITHVILVKIIFALNCNFITPNILLFLIVFISDCYDTEN